MGGAPQLSAGRYLRPTSITHIAPSPHGAEAATPRPARWYLPDSRTSLCGGLFIQLRKVARGVPLEPQP